MKNKAFFVAHAAVLLSSTVLAATWTGGTSGDLTAAANWDGDIAATAMSFTNDVSLSLSADATVHGVFWDGPADVLLGNRRVAFNLGGHTLRNETGGGFHAANSVFSFENGSFLDVADNGTTNKLVADDADCPFSLVVAGTGADWTGRLHFNGPAGCSFRLLDGATFHGQFGCAKGASTNEVSGGAALVYDAPSGNGGVAVGGCNVDGTSDASSGGSRHRLAVSGAGTLVSPPDPANAQGCFTIGMGGDGASGGANAVIVTDGATLVLPRYASVGHGGVSGGVERHSDGNELVVAGPGSSVANLASTADYPTAVGRWGSFNRILLADGATGRVKCISAGGAVRGEVNKPQTAAAYTSVCNRVTLDRGAVLDAYCVYAGFQHVNDKKVVAQSGAQCYSNVVEVLGGSALHATNAVSVIGACAPYHDNALVVSGSGSRAFFGGSNLIVGRAGSSSNRIEVLDGGSLHAKGNVYVGGGPSSAEESGFASDGATVVRGVGNAIHVAGAGSALVGGDRNKSLYLGSRTNGNENVVWVGDGGTLNWAGNVRCSGFDNVIAISGGTMTVGNGFIFPDNAAEGGRVKLVFSGAAPKLQYAGTSTFAVRNATVLRFEVPVAGWSEAPFQRTNSDKTLDFSGSDNRLEVNVRGYAGAGGGTVPLVHGKKGIAISSAQLAAFNADVAGQGATVSLSDDGKTLNLTVAGRLATVIIVR